MNLLFYIIFSYLLCFGFYGLGCISFIFFRHKKITNFINYLSLGILLSTIFFSIFIPSIQNGYFSFIIYLSCGLLFIYLLNVIVNYFFNNSCGNTLSICLSYFIHNIPEGILVGAPLGLIIFSNNISNVSLLLSITLCIALQNFPEGISIGFLLNSKTNNIKKIIFLSLFCGLSEPLFCFLCSIFSSFFNNTLLFILPFSCGIMLYTFIQQLISSYKSSEDYDLVSLFIMLGFIIMSLFEIFFSL